MLKCVNLCCIYFTYAKITVRKRKFQERISQLNKKFAFYRATACNATHGIAMSNMSVRSSACLYQTRGS